MDEKDFELLEVLGESRNITKAADKLFSLCGNGETGAWLGHCAGNCAERI